MASSTDLFDGENIVKMFPSFALLGALAFLAIANSGPVPFQGKENVFKYTVSIGKEVGQTFKNGFTIDSDVVVRKRSDSTYFIKVSR